MAEPLKMVTYGTGGGAGLLKISLKFLINALLHFNTGREHFCSPGFGLKKKKVPFAIVMLFWVYCDKIFSNSRILM